MAGQAAVVIVGKRAREREREREREGDLAPPDQTRPGTYRRQGRQIGTGNRCGAVNAGVGAGWARSAGYEGKGRGGAEIRINRNEMAARYLYLYVLLCLLLDCTKVEGVEGEGKRGEKMGGRGMSAVRTLVPVRCGARVRVGRYAFTSGHF